MGTLWRSPEKRCGDWIQAMGQEGESNRLGEGGVMGMKREEGTL